MTVTKKGWSLISLLIIWFVVLTLVTVLSGFSDFFSLAIRLFALYGFTMLVTATLLTPFLKEVVKNFGYPFIKVHHIFAVLGIVFITLHPVFLAISVFDATVFIPSFESWYAFWSLAGRPALILAYIAFAAAFFWKSKNKYWRIFHGLMYIVLFFGIVHGILIGTDFQNLAITIIFSILFASSITAFVIKRYKKYQNKMKKQ